MSWIAAVDTQAKQWPLPAQWAYLGVKWYLIGLGAFLVVRMTLHRTGIWMFY
jgi:hypothetical protein